MTTVDVVPGSIFARFYLRCMYGRILVVYIEFQRGAYIIFTWSNIQMYIEFWLLSVPWTRLSDMNFVRF